MSNILDALRDVIEEGKDLTEDQAFELFCEILDGETTIAQSAAIAVALRMKHESAGEIAGAVRAMRQKAVKLHPSSDNFVDLVGPGSNTPNLFDVHPIAAIVAAGAGVKAASHGNSGSWAGHGSAAVLEALGVNVKVPHTIATEAIDKLGLGFLFLDEINRGLTHLGPVRDDLRVRTIYNILGPLSNPVNAPAAVVGLPMQGGLQFAPDVLRAAGWKRAFVVAGEGGLDHVAVTGATSVLWLDIETNKKEHYTVNPEDFGLKRATLDQIKGGHTPEEEAEMALGLLKDRGGARRDLIVLNAAFAIAAYDGTQPAEAIKRATESIDSGAAMAKLEEAQNLYGGPVG